ncbi:WG repeat-containing protein [Oxynema sp. CENA135]|uniref:WG repeat-containing protein n=1 Tax=Oxynema sp. CENA135 TaxID=984206 RepID=UPI00190C1FED|nr:WG repeat-containing protein [Oxynema sp. CENA135]MBK4730907.1 WG repeat-containing protein [Oxynema sp. CENA135]
MQGQALNKLWQWWSRLTLVGAVAWTVQTPIALGFTDTGGLWNRPCVDRLFDRGFVSGYPDGSFRPNATVTRTEFAVLMLNTFPNIPRVRGPVNFNDVPSRYWGYNAIREASARAFFAGYPDGTFRPQQAIPRVQAIAIVANALGLIVPDENPAEILQQSFRDADRVPDYAKQAIAAGTLGGLAVNYPDVDRLRPNDNATRAEVAALLCQALGFDDTIAASSVVPARWRLAFPPTRGGFRQFDGGLTPIPIDGKYGYMDTSGTVVIPPEFAVASPFSDNLAAVAIPGDNGLMWGYITPDGEFAIEPQEQFSEAKSFAEGIAPVLVLDRYPNQSWKLIDRTGEIVASTDLSGRIEPFSDGLAKIIVNLSQIGYLDRQGNIVIEPQYWQGGSFSEGLAAVRVNLDSQWGYIDKTGAWAIAPQYERAGQFSEGLAPAKSNGKWGYIDNTGEWAIAPQFYAPVAERPADGGDARVLPAEIPAALPFSEGLAAVQLGEKAGFIDRQGNFVIPPVFAQADSFSDGLARVNLGGNWVAVGGSFVPQVMVFADYNTILDGGMWGYIRHPNP